MRIRVLAIIAALMVADVALAQTERIGPGGIPMAPGPSQPRNFTPGGIGAGGVQVAPGTAARGVNVERIGPGGGPLAPGPAGTVSGASAARTPTVAASSGGITGTIHSSRRHSHHRKKPRPSPRLY